MSDRFIKFNDEQLDAKQVMMLQDLARLLLKMSKRKLKYKNSLTIILIVIHSLVSWFWSHRPKHIEQAGLKQMSYSQRMDI